MCWAEAMCKITCYIQDSMCVFSLSMGLEVKEWDIVSCTADGRGPDHCDIVWRRHPTYIRLGLGRE